MVADKQLAELNIKLTGEAREALQKADPAERTDVDSHATERDM